MIHQVQNYIEKREIYESIQEAHTVSNDTYNKSICILCGHKANIYHPEE